MKPQKLMKRIKKKKKTIYRIRDTVTRTHIQTQTRKNNKDAKAWWVLIQKSKNVKKKYETQKRKFPRRWDCRDPPTLLCGWMTVFPCNYRRRSIYNKEVFL